MTLQLPDFRSARVLVIGDLMLDRYWHGATSRISPEAPVPVVHVKSGEERPGGAGNVALNLAALGCQTQLLAVTGEDEEAKILEQQLKEAGVVTKLHGFDSHPTITKLRVLSQHQQLIRLDFESGFSANQVEILLDAYQASLDEVDAIVLSDYGKGIAQIANTLIELAHGAGKAILVDPKSSDFSRYQKATCITPNFKEFQLVAGTVASDEDLVEKAKRLLSTHQLSNLLVTRGEHGMSLFQHEGDTLHLPTVAQEVFDVTGAGDTVIAVLSAGIAAGLDFESATELSNIAAGLVVSRLGAVSISEAELRQAYLATQEQEPEPPTEDELLQVIADARAHGETVVMTNGCFDLLHPGHVAYLREAKKLGDKLIVAVNTDASVAELKGPKRPINQLVDRMAMLSALKPVDYVIPFSEQTPERLISKLLPDVLVKGGDYKAETIAGSKAVRDNGGEVKILSFKEGYSSSKLIDQIQSDT